MVDDAIRWLSLRGVNRNGARADARFRTGAEAASIRRPPYAGLVNLTRSPRQADEWQVSTLDPADVPDGYDPSFARGLLFAVPLSGLLWLALYELYRAVAG
jgi:hypothetical protein